MSININFLKSSKEINGDIQYQLNLIKYLKYNNYKIIEGSFGFRTILSIATHLIGKILIRITVFNNVLKNYIHLIYRNYNFSFKKNYKILFTHFFFPFFEKKKLIIFSTMGVMYEQYFKNYNSLINLESDIYFHKYIDRYYNLIFLIWDKKLALRTKKICNIKSPIKILSPVLNINEKQNNKITIKTNKKIRLLFIGRNEKIKGLNYLLAAINNRKFEKYNFQADIITNQKYYLDNKKIKFHNDVNENFKNLLLKRADIFILPTLADTFGYSLLEAIAYKCAIITTNIYPVNQFCVKNKNGFLVRPKKTNDIIKYLDILMKNSKKIEKFKENSFQLYKNKFSHKIFKKKFKNIINQINNNNILTDV
jgi:glycosyltransferase involved in cell wall biosynthesis